MSVKERIARRVARELKDGDVVNLRIGLPTLVSSFLPPDVHYYPVVGEWLPGARTS